MTGSQHHHDKTKELMNSLFGRDIKELEERIKKDPVFLGVLLYKILEERENTNRILKNILQKLEKIEKSLSEKGKEKDLLPEQDEKIMKFIEERKRVTAEEVKEFMGYSGTNGASARLNRLVREGFLRKERVGKKVYFLLKQ